MIEPKHYREAFTSQNACNLSGVVLSFARAIEDLNRQGKGTDWINNHPICRLYAEQIMHLTNGREYSEAYTICQAKGAP